ncbi:MAG: LPS assembly protein LptD [Proteobacteria bacterium]|nr:LPS assembly protein LptD [Pseudomonadota bacterium]
MSFVFLMPSYAIAGEILPEPWQLEADRITSVQESEEVIAEGNVIFSREEQPGVKAITIKADKIFYNKKTSTIDAIGNISILSPEETIYSDKARLNLDTQTGVLNRISLYIKEQNLYFTGESVKKEGELTYSFKDGWVSACDTPPGGTAPWCIRSKEARVTMDDFAVLKHATFRIKDWPIAYTPYLIFPVKTKRESGFLFPEILHSNRDGSGFMAPYFIDISPSMDITLYPGYLSKRGVASAVEFRYVADSYSRGTFAINYLEDETTDYQKDPADPNDSNIDYRSDGKFRDLHDRYWVRGKIDQNLAKDLILRFDLDLVSDWDYLIEYREGMTGYSKSNADFVKGFNRGFQEESIPLRESTVELSKSWNSTVLGGEMRAVDDARSDKSLSEPVHTLPRLIFNNHPIFTFLPVSLDWDTEYVYYWREEDYGYQRLDTHPRLSIPVPLGSLVEGKMSAGVRETLYLIENNGESADPWEEGDSKNRTIVDFDINAATVLTKDYEMDIGSLRFVNHTFRPNIQYSYINSRTQKELPNLDSFDRISLANGLTYELNNYFSVGSILDEGIFSERYIGKLKISQTYDIAEARRQLKTNSNDERRPFSDILLDLNIQPLNRLSLEYHTAWDIYEDRIERYQFKGAYTDTRGDNLTFDYNYVPGTARDLTGTLTVKVTQDLQIKGDTTRSLLYDRTVSEKIGLIYAPHCWQVEINFSKTSDDQRIIFLFTLSGFGKAFEWGKDNL